MISYKVKGIILAVIISLSSIMMPFSVFADGLIVVNGSDYLLGINVDLYDSSLETYTNQAFITSNNGTSNYSQYTQTNVINSVEIGTYKYTFVFNKSYVGRVVLQYVVPGSTTTRQFTLFVNGSTAEYYSSRDNRFTATSTFINNWTLSSSQLVEHDDIESLEQIIDLLQDIYSDTTDLVGASADQLSELENIVANTELANDYLDTISKLRYYDIPVESFPYIVYCDQKYNSLEYLNQNEFYYTYPLYEIKNNLGFYTYINKNKGNYINVVYLISNYDASGSSYTLTYNNAVTNTSNKDLYFCSYMYNGRNVYLTLKWRQFYVNSSDYFQLRITSSDNVLFCPIYVGFEGDMNVSTDFALRYNLSNKLLDNLQIIANGTIQSNSAASNLENEASEYSEIADDVIGVEEGLTSNFETSVNQIDLNTGLNGFGGNFMTSATWVRTQFDRLTENTPYGSLVVYGLTLGFVLLMLGKVLL